MNDDNEVREFPDVGQKLAAPKKLSAYEKERQTAEAKRLRNEAETAAALRDFQNQFGEDDDEDDEDGFAKHSGGRGAGLDQYGRFTSSGHQLGSVSLGRGSNVPGIARKKRALDELREQQQAFRRSPPRLMSQGSAGRGAISGVHDNDQDIEQAAPRPTLLLSSLPPDSNQETVRALLKAHVEAIDIKIIPSPDRRIQTLSAIATLDAEVTNAEIDTIISGLRDKYIGFGYYLNISRHLSSQGLTAAQPILATSSKNDLPYGAVRRTEQAQSLGRAPPPKDYSQFAPPEMQYGLVSETRRAADAVVTVKPPLDLHLVRAIHTVANALLATHDPQVALEAEAFLMAKTEVQQDERFAFLFDSTSPAGIYYRYLLWRPDHMDEKPLRDAQQIDTCYDIEWISPHEQLPFSDLTDLRDVIDHIDYDSSEEEYDDDDVEAGLNNPASDQADTSVASRKAAGLLNPLQKARLASMLADLPKSRARLRNSDIAAITYFAICHAGHGAEDIVDLLLLNVTRPLSGMRVAKYMSQESEDGENHHSAEKIGTPAQDDVVATHETKREDDPSDARLIGLYVIADVLSAAAIAGAKNAWKYRQLFEAGFKAHHTFEQLARLDKELSMGRLKAEQWKKRVEHLLSLWRGNNMFSIEGQEEIEKAFLNPPMTEEELCAGESAQKKVGTVWPRSKLWGDVSSDDENDAEVQEETQGARVADAVVAAVDEDIDGEPMEEDIDGEPMEEEDIYGEPMDAVTEAETDTNGIGQPALSVQASGTTALIVPTNTVSVLLTASDRSSTQIPGPRRRMRAEDMFADSDGE